MSNEKRAWSPHALNVVYHSPVGKTRECETKMQTPPGVRKQENSILLYKMPGKTAYFRGKWDVNR